jgi:hypothetical protein
MFKAFWAVGTAALVAAGITFFPSLSPQVEASTPAPVVKGDRLDARTVSCTERAWPYYSADCLRRPAAAGSRPRPARLVTADRVAAR